MNKNTKNKQKMCLHNKIIKKIHAKIKICPHNVYSTIWGRHYTLNIMIIQPSSLGCNALNIMIIQHSGV